MRIKKITIWAIIIIYFSSFVSAQFDISGGSEGVFYGNPEDYLDNMGCDTEQGEICNDAPQPVPIGERGDVGDSTESMNEFLDALNNVIMEETEVKEMIDGEEVEPGQIIETEESGEAFIEEKFIEKEIETEQLIDESIEQRIIGLEKQQNILKYILGASGLIIMGLLIFIFHKIKFKNKNK